MVGVCRESERCRGKCCERIAKDSERLSAFQAIGVVAGGKFCEAGETVRNAFDGAKPDGPCSDRCKECGEDSGGGLVAPVAKKAGEADAQDGAVEPGSALRSFWQGSRV